MSHGCPIVRHHGTQVYPFLNQRLVLSSTVSNRRAVVGVNRCIACDSAVCRVVVDLTCEVGVQSHRLSDSYSLSTLSRRCFATTYKSTVGVHGTVEYRENLSTTATHIRWVISVRYMAVSELTAAGGQAAEAARVREVACGNRPVYALAVV